MRLTKNIRRPAQAFAIGGVDVLIAIPTKEKGKNTLVVQAGDTPDAPCAVTLAASLTDTVPVQIEFEDSGDAVCKFDDTVQFGANTYPVPTLGFKLGGRSNALNRVLEALIFTRHSFLVRMKTGEYLAVAVQNGAKTTTATSGGDGTPGGFAGYDVVVAGGETQLSPSITQASFEAMLALCPED